MTQERNQTLLIHRVLIQHISHLSLTGEGRNHIDSFFFRIHQQNGRLSLWRKAALIVFTIADSSLISPIYDSVFLLRPLGYSRVFFPFPPLDTRRILLPGTLYRALAAQAPAPHIIRCTPIRHLFSVCFPHIRTNLLQRPQIPWQPKLLRLPIYDCLPYFCFFLRQKNSPGTFRSPASVHF